MEIKKENRYRGQFLFTRDTVTTLGWDKIDINGFNLHFHNELMITCSVDGDRELVMLGSIYDWEMPAHTNQELLDSLCRTDTFDSFLKQLSKYLGEFVIIYKETGKLILLNDATGQHQIFYDTSFTTFGSQPKLLNEFIVPLPHTDRDLIEFYKSNLFHANKLFISDTTHLENVQHLLPNHYINVYEKSVIRYYPLEQINPVPVNEAVPKVCMMLKGYIKSVALRRKIAMAFTGGIDSRVLFFSSLEEECKYYVYKRSKMSDSFYDFTIPKIIAEKNDRAFEVIPFTDTYEDYLDSIDFPRDFHKPAKYFKDRIYLNGNISEMTRNMYGSLKKVSAQDLSIFKGYGRFKPVIKVYEKWLKDADYIKSKGYNVLNLFHWEQGLGIWVAKGKIEDNAAGMDVVSPFNSRDLLTLLLSVPSKYRNFHDNKLYYSILLELSPNALDLPINPCFGSYAKKCLTKMGVFNKLKYISLKCRY